MNLLFIFIPYHNIFTEETCTFLKPAIRIYCCNVSRKFRYLDFLGFFLKRGKWPLILILITASRHIRMLHDSMANEQISFSTSMDCAPVSHTACFPTKTPTPSCSALKQRHTRSREGFVRIRRPQTVQTNHLCSVLHPLESRPVVIRVDPDPGFMTLRNHPALESFGISLEIGRVKNRRM